MSQFEFRVYNARHNNIISYTLTHTKAGWHIQHIAVNGDCARDGAPFFYENFDQDNIAYPSSFDSFLESIWSGLTDGDLSASDAQARIQELADWVSTCERSKPKWKGWNV